MTASTIAGALSMRLNPVASDTAATLGKTQSKV
jgi:hypothetical protein